MQLPHPPKDSDDVLKIAAASTLRVMHTNQVLDASVKEAVRVARLQKVDKAWAIIQQRWGDGDDIHVTLFDRMNVLLPAGFMKYLSACATNSVKPCDKKFKEVRAARCCHACRRPANLP